MATPSNWDAFVVVLVLIPVGWGTLVFYQRYRHKRLLAQQADARKRLSLNGPTPRVLETGPVYPSENIQLHPQEPLRTEPRGVTRAAEEGGRDGEQLPSYQAARRDEPPRIGDGVGETNGGMPVLPPAVMVRDGSLALPPVYEVGPNA